MTIAPFCSEEGAAFAARNIFEAWLTVLNKEKQFLFRRLDNKLVFFLGMDNTRVLYGKKVEVLSLR